MASEAEQERAAIVAWLRGEAEDIRHGQQCASNGTERLYRMGQKDAALFLADAIEQGQHIKEASDVQASD